ncbi:hypothetical protein HELRODRAFT_168557 [Helobdella robusta]|uniref:PH domain-containing protein n=1 Tax=Helobdella robusta TaxID=6412 RepID=T1F0Q4_HELRO|nr:hypothetical protein HELRODRAFT_168557 [Helobdella robusta]ESO09555.1 hypothetical protein HELRODRAFT_168557 [Helobdella robusta]
MACLINNLIRLKMTACRYEAEELQVVKAGFLRKYKKGFLSKGFKAVYVELTRDSYFMWYRDQTSYKRDGILHLKTVCDYLAVGPYTRSVPGRPNLSRHVNERHLLAVPSTPCRNSLVHWFLCANDADLKGLIYLTVSNAVIFKYPVSGLGKLQSACVPRSYFMSKKRSTRHYDQKKRKRNHKSYKILPWVEKIAIKVHMRPFEDGIVLNAALTAKNLPTPDLS